MTVRVLTVLSLIAVAAAGCSRNTGYVIKPVALDEAMSETVIQADPGLFVTDRIALLDVSGLLFNQREEGLLAANENPVSAFIEKVDKAQDDARVKAVIVRINSPGGGVTAADIMYNRLKQFRAARRVPVITIIEDVGASGGYYLACAGDTIIAHPTSVTGSIGVIVQTLSLAGTMKLIGVEAYAVTSGRHKDMGSMLKPLDKDDQAVIQSMVNDFYSRFLKVVAAGRPRLTEDKIKELADGRVYSGDQAKANGLVDSLGYMSDAVALAKSRAGLTRAKVVMYHRPYGSRANAYSAAALPQPQVNLVNISVPGLLSLTQPQFLYLWTGKN